MKILVISNLYPPNVLGGYEVGCAEMVKQLRSMSHEVTVLTSRGASDFSTTESDEGIRRVLTLSDVYSGELSGDALNAVNRFYGRVIDLANVALILEELCSQNYDVVYCFNLEGLGTLAICDLLTDLKVPWVWHLMDCTPKITIEGLRPDIGVIFSAYANRQVGASRVITMSERLLAEITEAGISLGDSVSVIPGWAPEPAPPVKTVRNGKLAFASIGVVCENKGSDLIIEALGLLDPAILEKISVDFFGRGDLADYRSRVGRSGLSRQVTFRGQVSHREVMSALSNYDGLLFPTWEREPFGFVALEAAAHGVTPVITRGIGAAEVLADNVHSIHIERNPEQLRAAIIDAVENPDRFRAIGHDARSLVMSNFLLPMIARRVENELLGVAEPIRIGRDLAQRFIDINRFKYRLSRQHVTGTQGNAPNERLTVAPSPADAYRQLKYTGRDASKSMFMRLLRSGVMKIMRPYFTEILGRQQQLTEELRSANDRIGFLNSRIEEQHIREDSQRE